MSTLRLLFLGPPQIIRDGRSVAPGAAKAVALLACLAVRGTPQAREHLADLLWPDSLPDAARKNLRNTLWTLRKALGDDLLSHPDADRVALSDAVWVDVHAFEAAVPSLLEAETPVAGDLEAAIALYRAPLLDGFTFPKAPDLEIWLVTERERFGRLYLRALEALVAAHRATGNWPDVIAVARRALAGDNLQEPMYRALMEAHARRGERSEALRQYDRLSATLARELGVEPLAETKALRRKILSGDLPSLEPPSPPRRTYGGGRPARPPFIGRRAERAALDQEWQLAAAGGARVVLIAGELGIGKSRLWQEWSATLPAGSTVLETRCLDMTRSLPFAPLAGLFSQPVVIDRLFKPPLPISPIWLGELSRLLPEVGQHWPDMPPPTMLPPEEERHRLFEALTQALRALDGRPLILFIDDLHWVDHATLDWLIYLVDRMYDERLMLVGAYRPDEAPAPLVHLVARWGRESVARRLPLPRLTLEEATEVIAALGGDVTLAGQVQTKSAGNPYFLLELSLAAPGKTPPELAELVRMRLDRLSSTSRQVVQAAAVLGADFDFATLRRTGGRGEEETLDALDDLLDAAVLVEQKGRYEFVHPLAATVVREGLNVARRSFLHRRAAEALEATYAGHLAPIAGQLAMHYAQAGRPAKAARYADQAAGRALELVAPAEAVAFYRQAFSLAPTPARRLGLGRALYVQGDLEGARGVLCDALAELEAAGDRSGAVRACLALAESYLPSGQGDKVIQWAERALGGLDSQSDPEALAYVHYLLGAGRSQAGHSLTEAGVHLGRAGDLAAENDLPEMAARSQFELGNLLAQRGDLAKALEAFEKAIVLARAAGSRFLELLGHNNLAYHAHLAGDLATAQKHVETGLALSETHSLFLPRQYLYSTRGEIALAEGQLDQAEAWFARGLAEAEKHGNRLQAANIHANRGLVARARGDLDVALVLLQAAGDAAADVPALHLQIQIDLWLAELYLQREERAAAGKALKRAEAQLAGGERRGLQAWATRVRAALQR